MRVNDAIRLTFVMTGLLLAGCSGGGPSGSAVALDGAGDAEAGREAGRGTLDEGGGMREADSEAGRLARQAERDVAALLQRRAESEKTGAYAEPGEPGSAARQIIWNDTGVAGTARPSAGRREAPAEANRAVEMQPGPASEIAPLYRKPAEELTVQPMTPVEAEAVAATEAAGTNLAPEPLEMLLVKVRQELYQRSIDSDQPLRELISLAAVSMADPELDLHPEFFRQLTDTERELLRELQTFFAELGRNLDDSHDASEVIGAAVQELEARIIEQPTLELPTAVLCWRVGGFGDYDQFDKCVFLAHAEQRMILYLEIDGFTSELNKKQQWVTELSQQLEIISDDDKIPVWSEPWQKAPDVSNQRRRDFFTTQIITLPKALSVGRYALKIWVRDEKSGAEAETTIAFEMVADEKLTAKVPR